MTTSQSAPHAGADLVGRTGGAEPRPYKLPRKKATLIIISAAPSIDSSRSNATSCKFDAPVSGGAYQDARKVTLVWNDNQKLGSQLNSGAGGTNRVQALFSPLSFLLREKR